jgi:hypothetical protein
MIDASLTRIGRHRLLPKHKVITGRKPFNSRIAVPSFGATPC